MNRAWLLFGSTLLWTVAGPALATETLPFVFEENVGQAGRGVDWLGASASGTVTLDTLGFSVIHAGQHARDVKHGRMSCRFDGARQGPAARVVVDEAAAVPVHVVVGEKTFHPRAAWSVRIQNAWPGVDAIFRATPSGPRVDFQLAAGVDSSRIRLRCDAPLVLQDDGTLQGEQGLMVGRPSATQRGQPLRASLVKLGANTWGVKVQGARPHAPVLVDPLLSYATYLGDTAWQPLRVAADRSGNAVVAHTVTGPTMDDDVVVTRVDPRQVGAASLLSVTRLGGTGDEFPNAVSVSALGYIAVAGKAAGTGIPFPGGPVPSGLVLRTAGAFVVVLDDALRNVRFGARLSTLNAEATSVEMVDDLLYVTGVNDGALVLKNSYATTGSAFFTVLNSRATGTNALVYSTAFGTNATPQNLVVQRGLHTQDPLVVILGDGTGAVLPVPTRALSTTPNDLWLVTFDPAQRGGTSLYAATYLPGSAVETLSGGTTLSMVALPSTLVSRTVVVAGTTRSADVFGSFTPPAGVVGPAYTTGQDVFLMRLPVDLERVVAGTYVGGAGNQTTFSLATGPAGQLWLGTVLSQGGVWPTTACSETNIPAALTVGAVASITSDFTSISFATRLPGFINPGSLAYGRSLLIAALATPTNVPATLFQNGFDTDGVMNTPALLTLDTAQCDAADPALSARGPLSAQLNAGFSVRFSVRNAGVLPSTGTRVGFTLPAGISAAAFVPAICNVVGTGVSCNLGTVAPQATASVSFPMRGTTLGLKTINATVSTTATEQNANNNTTDHAVEIVPVGGACGNVAETGACNGTVLSFCTAPGTAGETLTTVDCATQVFPQDISGSCTLIDDVYGYDCAVAQGQVCQFLDENNLPVFAYCQGTTPGCVEDLAAARIQCTTLAAPCVPVATGDYVPTCVGNVLTLDCRSGQPVGVDCASGGGVCLDGQCQQLPQDLPCGDLFTCAAGSVCNAPTQTCQPVNDICDPTTFVRTCNSAALTLCDSTTLLATDVDCAQAITGGACGTPYTCVGTGCGTPLGCFAGGGAGAACSSTAGVFCGPGLGCVFRYDVTGANETCRNVGNCGADAGHIGCVNNIATSCLSGPEAYVVEAAGLDCTSWGSTCVLDQAGQPVCVGAAGARCLAQAGSAVGCETGLACITTGTAFGTCGTPPPDGGVLGDGGTGEDGGVVSSSSGGGSSGGGSSGGTGSSGAVSGGSSGTVASGSSSSGGDVPPEEDPPGCACQGNGQAPTPWMLLAGLVLWGLRPRRNKNVRRMKQEP